MIYRILYIRAASEAVLKRLFATQAGDIPVVRAKEALRRRPDDTKPDDWDWQAAWPSGGLIVIGEGGWKVEPVFDGETMVTPGERWPGFFLALGVPLDRDTSALRALAQVRGVTFVTAAEAGR